MEVTEKWTVGEIARAVGGQLNQEKYADTAVGGVHFDTRQLKPHDLFVPLVAARDGHDFVSQAIEHEAAATFWNADVEGAPENFPVIFVPDPEQAFNKLAQYHLKKTKVKVVAITGSNGKTTTKDLTAGILSQLYAVYKTQANLNNQIGVPKTILDMPLGTEVIVLEMGMDRPGEVAELSEMYRPDVAVVTMIGESHLEYFGSRENIAKHKMDIAKGLKPYGTLLYLADEPLLQARANLIPNTLTARTFGVKAPANFSGTAIKEYADHTTFKIKEDPHDAIWEIPVPGRYNVTNALAAIGVGRTLSLDWNEIRKGLTEASLTKNRLEWLEGIHGEKILNDAYNASPTSMKAALNYFAHLETDRHKKVVIGDMRELGQNSANMHAQLSQEVPFAAFDKIYLFGEEMRALQKVLMMNTKLNVEHFTHQDVLIQTLKKELTAKDAVLFKSSLGTDLLSVVDVLKKVTAADD